jgi:phosphatidylserine decarboxylase
LDKKPTATPAPATHRHPLKERLFVASQYVLPHHPLSWVVRQLANSTWPPLKQRLIDQAIRHFGIDLQEAAIADPQAYESFNAFFTRALREGARPLAGEPDALLCPVDGAVSQVGEIAGGRIIQAKGHDYSVAELLGNDETWPKVFDGGSFANLYLSPRDYHRIHMPLTGSLIRTIHIPGRLFSVNPVTTRQVPRLFARNERIACLFETAAGPMAVILVGAIFVSSMETVWGGVLATPRQLEVCDYGPPAMSVELARGAELGRFNMGSTVILLFGKGKARWSSGLKAGMKVRMGQRIGVIHPRHAPPPPQG